MMKLIYHLFRMDPEDREDVITITSGLGIVINLLIAAAKVILGVLASSIAIISEGVNNGADALSSVLTLVGTKLAGRHPDEKHPFGYGRIEYLTSLIIATMILVTGIEMLSSAVSAVFSPTDLEVSYLSLGIIAASAVVKFLLGTYTIAMGKKSGSGSLEAVGKEGRADSLISVLTIASALLFLFFHLNVDGYVGVFTSIIIIKAGGEVLIETVSELIGRQGDEELARKLYKEIRSTEGVLLAVDMMLHNYGPDRWSGSCNLEMDHKKTVGEVYQILHELQIRIMQQYHVTMVFGIYAVDNDNAKIREIRLALNQFIHSKEHVKSYHAVYIEPETERIYCDFIVDYKLKDWKALEKEFKAYMQEKYPDHPVVLTIETEFV